MGFKVTSISWPFAAPAISAQGDKSQILICEFGVVTQNSTLKSQNWSNYLDGTPHKPPPRHRPYNQRRCLPSARNHRGN